eukprot:5309716-Prymnesium_polylepis.2
MRLSSPSESEQSSVGALAGLPFTDGGPVRARMPLLAAEKGIIREGGGTECPLSAARAPSRAPLGSIRVGHVAECQNNGSQPITLAA